GCQAAGTVWRQLLGHLSAKCLSSGSVGRWGNLLKPNLPHQPVRLGSMHSPWPNADHVRAESDTGRSGNTSGIELWIVGTATGSRRADGGRTGDDAQSSPAEGDTHPD